MPDQITQESITSEYSLEDFHYELPPELIAQEPLSERTSSRLLAVNRHQGTIVHANFADIGKLLSAGDVLVLNDTRVIPARLIARRAGGGQVEFLLIKPHTGGEGLWQAMAAPLRKLKPDEVLTVATPAEEFAVRVAGFCSSADGQRRVIIDAGPADAVFRLLTAAGQAPLPPYIHPKSEQLSRERQLERYQTVFARSPGAVAAPTAGLHFTDELLQSLQDKGVEVCYLTLHVGPGTFKPVTTSIQEHVVEAETFSIAPSTAAIVNKAKEDGRRVIAVGTTSCRALETAGASGMVQATENGITGLYIRPGYQFRIIDALITNFHLSRSSLLILVCAFAGKELIMQAYQAAIQERYRFYSFGDAMFIQ